MLHLGALFKQPQYRNSQIYTYEKLSKVIEESASNGINNCHTLNKGEIIYRDWTSWLSEYFKPVPHITDYQHFRLNSEEQGIITIRQTIDSEDKKITLIREKNLLIRLRYNDQKCIVRFNQ